MCIFTHVAAGAFVGSLAPTPLAAPFLGLGSHIMLDIMPHYDIDSVMLEIVFGAIVFAVIVIGGAASAGILLGASFAVLPDLENLLWKLGMIPHRWKVFPGHAGVIPHGRKAGVANLLGQIAVSAVLVVYLLWRFA